MPRRSCAHARPVERRPAAVAVAAALAAVLLGGCTASGAGSAASSAGRSSSPATHAGATGGTASPSTTTSPAVRPGPPQPLTVVTSPRGARLTVVGADRAVLRGRTPFHGQVAGGPVQLTVRLAGYQPVRRTVMLRHPRRLRLWLDPAGLLLRSDWRSRTGSDPKQVAFTPDGRQMWVTLLGERHDGVEVFDASNGRLLRRIRTGEHGAVEVLFSSDGRTAYVSQMWDGDVLEIDTRTYRIRRVLPTHGRWSKEMTLSPDGKRLYISNWESNDVSEITLRTGHVRLIPTVRTPRGVYLTPDGRHLYVAGFGDGDLEDVDLVTGQHRLLLHTGGAMRHLVGDPRRGLAYADDMALGAVFVVDTATDHVRRLASTDHMPNTLGLSPDGKVLYVSCRGENNPRTYYLPGPEWGSVVVIDTRTGRELDAIVGGNQPTGLGVSPDGRKLAYTNFLDNDVRVYQIPPYPVYAHGGGGRSRSHLADLPKR